MGEEFPWQAETNGADSLPLTVQEALLSDDVVAAVSFVGGFRSTEIELLAQRFSVFLTHVVFTFFLDPFGFAGWAPSAGSPLWAVILTSRRTGVNILSLLPVPLSVALMDGPPTRTIDLIPPWLRQTCNHLRPRPSMDSCRGP